MEDFLRMNEIFVEIKLNFGAWKDIHISNYNYKDDNKINIGLGILTLSLDYVTNCLSSWKDTFFGEINKSIINKPTNQYINKLIG